MSPALVRRALLVPVMSGKITPSDSRLLTYMADRASDHGLFWEGRPRTCAALGMHPDSVKKSLARLEAAGYVEETRSAVKGKRTRCLRLLPDAWPSPGPTDSEVGDATTATDAAAPAMTPSAGVRAAREALAQVRATG